MATTKRMERWRWALLLAGLSLGVGTYTQALGAACPQQEVMSQAAAEMIWPRIGEKVKLNNAYWVDTTWIEIQRQERNILLLDVRLQREIKAHPLQGVWEIPLAQLQGKSFLREQHIVLVGTGFDQALLDQACEQLRAAGFENVVALRGGVRALINWPQAQFSGIESEQITPEEFWLGSPAMEWQIVTFGLSQEQIDRLPEPPIEDPAKRLSLSERTQKLGDSEAKRWIEYVYIAPDAAATQALQQAFSSSGLTKNTVWLTGGMQAYENYMREQYDILNHAGRALLRPCAG